MRTWWRYRYAMFVGWWRARRTRRPSSIAPTHSPGQVQREAAWVFWGLAWLFPPAALASAALSVAAEREAQRARQTQLRRVRLWGIGLSVASGLLAALLFALEHHW